MPPSVDEIRVGLIGYGWAGKTFHAPLIAATAGLRLTVVGSSQPEAVRADFPDVAVVEGEAVATAAEVDLVVIAAPNDCHAPLARAALEAGKHVVVDKPFALSLAEARNRELGENADRLISVFQNRRWDSDFLAVKAVIAQGALHRARCGILNRISTVIAQLCATAGASERPRRVQACGRTWGHI